MPLFRKLLRDQRGVSAIEYCLLAAFIALGIVTSVGELGRNVTNGIDTAESTLSDDGKGGKKGKDGKKDKKGGKGKGPK